MNLYKIGKYTVASELSKDETGKILKIIHDIGYINSVQETLLFLTTMYKGGYIDISSVEPVDVKVVEESKYGSEIIDIISNLPKEAREDIEKYSLHEAIKKSVSIAMADGLDKQTTIKLILKTLKTFKDVIENK